MSYNIFLNINNFPDLIKKKAAINPIKNKDNKRFKFNVTVTLSHEQINKVIGIKLRKMN